MNFEYVRKFNKGVERPKGVPSDWVVNPFNNVDVSFVTNKNYKDKTRLRENWVSPEALIKRLEELYEGISEKDIPAIPERQTNQEILDLEKRIKDSEKQ